MTDNTYWKTRVLEKLRTIVINGALSNTVKWKYDNNESITIENKNLMALHTLGVVDVSRLTNNAPDAFYENDDKILISDESTNIVAFNMGTPNGEVIIRNLNSIEYEKICIESGLSPRQEEYLAQIEIAGIGTPIVTVGNQRYIFSSLHSGSYKEKLLTLLFEQPEKTFSLEDIKANKGFSTITNLNKLVENSYLSKELAPFICITKNSVRLQPKTNLDKSQFEQIKNYGNKKI